MSPAAHWVERLEEAAKSPLGLEERGLCAELSALGEPERAQLAGELKAALDRCVRVEPPRALPLALALSLVAGDSLPLRAIALRGRAVAMHFNGRNLEAFEAFEAAAALHLEQGDEVQAGLAWRSLIEVCHQLGRGSEALAFGEQARGAFEKHGQRRLLAELDTNLGNVFVRQDEYLLAAKHYTQARAEFSELKEAVGVAYTDFNLAVVAMNRSQIAESREAWGRARAGMLAAGQALHVADCDYNLAYLESRAGDHYTAVLGLERARALYLENKKPAGVPLCDLDLADIHLRLGAFARGLEYAQRARASFETLGLRYETARCEVLIGVAQARLGSLDSGLKSLESARQHFSALNNTVSEHLVELHSAAILCDQAQAARAFQLAQNAKAAFVQRDMPLLAALATLVVARSQLLAGQVLECRAQLAELDALSSQASLGGLVQLERQVLEAKALELLGQRELAVVALERAIAHIDGTYRHVPCQETRLAFLREQHSAFIDLAFLLYSSANALDQARGTQSAQDQEIQAKLRAALVAVEEGRLHRQDLEMGLNLLDSPETQAARARVEFLLARKLETELGYETSVVRGAGPALGELEQAQIALEALEGRSLVRNSRQRRRFDLEHLGLQLVASEACLVFATSARGVLAFRLEAGQVHCRQLPLFAEQLEALADRLAFHMDRLRLCETYLQRRHATLARSLDAILDELGQALLAPMLAGSSAKELLIVPYGVLHDLPFHAFRVGGEPLMAARDVSYAYGLSPAGKREQRLSRGTSAPATLYVLDAGGTSLHQTPAEIAEICDLYTGPNRRLDWSSLRSQFAPRGGLLHVAGHGVFQPEHPEFSALSDGRSFLFERDIRQLALDLDLVCLSGCETGRKARLFGEELVSLTRAFLDSGSRAVLASAWPVEDSATRRLMVHFYGALAAGHSARRAINLAWRRMAKIGPGSPKEDPAYLPCHWAAFALHGDAHVRFA